MNPEAKQEADRQISVQQAARDGKRIEVSARDNSIGWCHAPNPVFDWHHCDYRIAADSDKPEWPADAPPWAQWAAIDVDGNVLYCKGNEKPPETCRDSLIQRPQEKPEPKQAREVITQKESFDAACNACGFYNESPAVKTFWNKAISWERKRREVPPGRMTFAQFQQTPKYCELRKKVHNISFSEWEKGVWDACAENGEDFWRSECARIRGMAEDQLTQLTRERDEARRELDEHRLAAVGEWSFEEWLDKWQTDKQGATVNAHEWWLQEAYTEQIEGLQTDKNVLTARGKELAQERDALRQQLSRSTEDHQNIIQTLIERDRQLSDAQAEVKELREGNETRDKLQRIQVKLIQDTQAEVKRLEERRVHVEASTNEICKQKDDLASTVERLRVALTTLGKNVKMLQHHSGLASGMEGQGRTQEARAQWKCFDQLVDDSLLLASITAPASVPTGLVEMLRETFSKIRFRATAYQYSDNSMMKEDGTNWVKLCEEAIALCERHLS